MGRGLTGLRCHRATTLRRQAQTGLAESRGRPMQSGPLVSVTIPSYNYEQYLAEAVESAATQRGVRVEVVIVDNASTDCSLALARRLAQEYDNVRVVEYAENHGIISSLNRCRDEVRGEYAVLLCADDCLTPG